MAFRILVHQIPAHRHGHRFSLVLLVTFTAVGRFSVRLFPRSGTYDPKLCKARLRDA